jgi:hypothetical protein
MNPFKYSVSGIAGWIGWSADCASRRMHAQVRTDTARGAVERVQQALGAEMVRTGATDDQAAVGHQTQRGLVDASIGQRALLGVLLALDEGGRIDDHDIEALAIDRAVVLQASKASSLRIDTFAATPLACALRSTLASAEAELSTHSALAAPCTAAHTPQPPP